MEAEKKAKLVSHTSWTGSGQTHNPQQAQHYNLIPPNHAYNPTPQTLPSAPPFNPFQPLPAFSYNPYPANWQPSQPTPQVIQPQPSSSNPQESLPPPPPGPPLKEENSNPHQSQPGPLPTFGMIMPISEGSSLEFKNKIQRKNYFRQVHSIMPEGLYKKTQWSQSPITFSEENVHLLSYPHTDALVIEANIQGWTIGKILVDTGSSADIIFSNTFDRMNIDRNLLQPSDIPLIGFRGKRVNALGKIWWKRGSTNLKLWSINFTSA